MVCRQEEPVKEIRPRGGRKQRIDESEKNQENEAFGKRSCIEFKVMSKKQTLSFGSGKGASSLVGGLAT